MFAMHGSKSFCAGQHRVNVCTAWYMGIASLMSLSAAWLWAMFTAFTVDLEGCNNQHCCSVRSGMKSANKVIILRILKAPFYFDNHDD